MAAMRRSMVRVRFLLRFMAAWMVLLALSPNVAAAVESIVDLTAEAAPPLCCPDDIPQDVPGDGDCSRTCRSCSCCLPVAYVGHPAPKLESTAQAFVHEGFAAVVGSLLPAHARSLFRPPA